MKKRILAMALALLMLVGTPVAYAGSAWQQASEHYNGGLLQYGNIELRCDDSYAVLRFAYGSNVNLGETTMQDIAAQLEGNQFPVVSPFSSREQTGTRNFFVVMADDQASVDHLIVDLEELAALQEEKQAALQEEAAANAAVSESDAAAQELTKDELAKLFDLFFSLNSDKDDAAASGSDVSASDVTSASDAVSSSDISASEIADEDKSSLMAMLDMLSFNKLTSDGDAPAADVSFSDVSASDIQADEKITEDDVPETVTEEKAEGTIPTVSESDAAEAIVNYRPVIDTLLSLRSAGMFSIDALPTLEQTLERVFPGFYFADTEKQIFSPVASENVILSGDCLTAQVLLRPESEYVDVELNGKIFSVLLMNQKSTSYTVKHVYVHGSTDKQPVIPPATTTTSTEPAPTTTETTTTTTETTTTTTAPTTAATTTTTTATTTQTTTTTTAPVITGDKQLTGYVSTRKLVLRVRTGPGFEYDVIKSIPKGTEVTILGQPNDEWYQVRLNDGTVGYCYTYYITIHKDK